MTALANYFEELLNWIPKEVALAVVIVIVMTEITKRIMRLLEEDLETKYKKEIKIFDHTKIIFVTFWSIFASVFLVMAGVYTWQAMPLYFLAILGAAVILYEYVVKRLNKIWKDEEIVKEN